MYFVIPATSTNNKGHLIFRWPLLFISIINKTHRSPDAVKRNPESLPGFHCVTSGLLTELRQWQEAFGKRGFVFPSPQGGKYIRRESIEKVYRITLKLSKKHAPHGWRNAFSTLARYEGFARAVVELALDHAHDNEVALAYDRGERFSQRIELLNWWEKQLSAARLRSKNHHITKQRSSELM